MSFRRIGVLPRSINQNLPPGGRNAHKPMGSLKNEALSRKVIGAFYKVYRTLGYGFLEKVYENAMFLELTSMGLAVSQQHPIDVYYESTQVGAYFADLIVNHEIIVELKAADAIAEAHEAQLLNYLKATPVEVGLLLNFGPSPEFRRKIFSNERKSWRMERGGTRTMRNDRENGTRKNADGAE